jgi:hypothetical protein
MAAGLLPGLVVVAPVIKPAPLPPPLMQTEDLRAQPSGGWHASIGGAVKLRAIAGSRNETVNALPGTHLSNDALF